MYTFRYIVNKKGGTLKCFCVKLIDNTGNEHLILILDKYAKIEIEEGSMIVKYESGGKTNILFSSDKLREADYDMEGTKVVGIDCTTRKSYIMDLDMYDIVYKEQCGVNEICELGLHSNLSKVLLLDFLKSFGF